MTNAGGRAILTELSGTGVQKGSEDAKKFEKGRKKHLTNGGASGMIQKSLKAGMRKGGGQKERSLKKVWKST